ncbi:MAG: hypothetical protein AABZ47_09640 [Planctomycetota bacterium]
MSSSLKWRKVAAIVLSGGCLLQTAGCAGTVGALVTSYLESSLLTLLVQLITPP